VGELCDFQEKVKKTFGENNIGENSRKIRKKLEKVREKKRCQQKQNESNNKKQ